MMRLGGEIEGGMEIGVEEAFEFYGWDDKYLLHLLPLHFHHLSVHTLCTCMYLSYSSFDMD